MNTRANRKVHGDDVDLSGRHAVVLGGSLAGLLAARRYRVGREEIDGGNVMKTRTEITVEMDRLIVVNPSGRSEWCSCCSRPVEMLSIDNAALLAHVNSLTIFRWAIKGELHSAESAEGLLLICPNSPKLALV